MRRLHLSLHVDDVATAIPFFEALLGVSATDVRDGFAKFLVDDPGLNLALSSGGAPGVDHVGLQMDSEDELQATVQRLRGVTPVTEPGQTTCCYAKSTKGWAQGPEGLPWELFVTHEYVEEFGNPFVPEVRADGACCVPEEAPATSGGSCCGSAA
jgi:catechol 2,3-dioxygenase-like lactoylglutathione lyase family enzyme